MNRTIIIEMQAMGGLGSAFRSKKSYIAEVISA